MAELRMMHNLTVDAAEKNFLVRADLVQHSDNGFVINVRKLGESIDLTNVRDVLLVSQPPKIGKLPVVSQGTVTGESQVTVNLKPGAVAWPGIVRSQLKLIGQGGGLISTLRFAYQVQEDLSADMPTDEEKSFFEDAVTELHLSSDRAEEAATEALKARDRLTGEVGAAIRTLNTDKAAALEEMQGATTEMLGSTSDAIEGIETRTTEAISTLNTEKTTAINELNEVKEANRTRRLDAVATIAERDALTPQQGDTVTVLNDGQGNTVEYQFFAGEWKVTDRVSATAYAEVSQQLADTENKLSTKADFANVQTLAAQKADVSYVDTKVQAANIAWKESFATVTDLQNAYPSGDIYNHVVLEDGMIYTWANDVWLNTQIQANGTGIADNTVNFSSMTEDAKKGLGGMTSKRMMMGDTNNLILIPPGERPLSTYANEVGDPYFASLQHSNTTPYASITRDAGVTVHPGGFWFYRMRIAEKFLTSGLFTIFLNVKMSDASKAELRFMDENSLTIGLIFPLTDFGDGVFGVEGHIIPAGATTAEIRLDNRGATIDAVYSDITVVAARFLGARDERIPAVTEDIIALRSDLQATNADLPKYKATIPVLTPVDFPWKDHPLRGRIFTDGKGAFYTNFDVSEMKVKGGTDYYVAPNGLSSNSGLSSELPLPNIRDALAKTDVGTIWVKGGDYFRTPQGAHPIGTISKNVNIIAYDGIARIIYANSLTWTKTEGYSNVYQATRAGVTRMIDSSHMEDEDYLEMKSVASIAEVDSNPNSWYTESGVLYVRTIDDRPADSAVWGLLSNLNATIDATPTAVYAEGLEIIGGAAPLRIQTETGSLFTKKCKFLFSAQSNGDGLQIFGGRLIISQECVASRNSMDGFNYHKSANGVLPNFIEIDCIGRNNGLLRGEGGQRSDNGSTAHDGIVGIRVEGKYYRNDGGNVADVNTGTKAWNLGATAFESLQGTDFLLTNGAAESWFDHCTAYGSTNSLQVADTANAHVRMSNWQTETAVGTVATY